MEFTANLIGFGVMMIVACALVLYVGWALVRAYVAKEEIRALEGRFAMARDDRFKAFNMAARAMGTADGLKSRVDGINKRLGEVADARQKTNNLVAQAHNMGNVALGIAKKNQRDLVEVLEENESQADDLAILASRDRENRRLISQQSNHLAEAIRKVEALGLVIEEQQKDIERLRKTKAPIQKKPAARKTTRKKPA